MYEGNKDTVDGHWTRPSQTENEIDKHWISQQGKKLLDMRQIDMYIHMYSSYSTHNAMR